MKTKYNITEETKSALLGIRRKVEIERNPALFTPQEKVIMEQAYNELTGKVASRSCQGMCEKVRTSLKNWFAINDKEEAESVTIDERALKPVELDTTKEGVIEVFEKVAKNMNDYTLEELEGYTIAELESYTLAELRELYPNIKSNSKAKFITKIKENGN